MFGGTSLPDDSIVGSPLKKHRASIADLDSGFMSKGNAGHFGSLGHGVDVVAAAEAAQNPLPEIKMEEEQL